MPEFISLLRWIRDTAYPEIKTAYDSFIGATVGTVTNIDPIDGTVQPATVTYDGLTGVFDFGIPTSPVVDNTSASLIRANGSVPMDTGYVPAVALDVVTKEYADLIKPDSIAGEEIIADSTGEIVSVDLTPTKAKEIKISRDGEARIVFSLKIEDATAIASGQVYVNGIATGVLNTTTSITYVNFTEDIVGLKTDDLIQLYINTSDATKLVATNSLQYNVSNPLIAYVTL